MNDEKKRAQTTNDAKITTKVLSTAVTGSMEKLSVFIKKCCSLFSGRPKQIQSNRWILPDACVLI